MTQSSEEPDRSRPEGEEDPTGGAGAGPEESVDFGEGKGPAEADTPGDPEVELGPGGYAGRDPKSDMPRMPSVPETQEDPKSHGGEPPQDSEPPASN